MQRKRFFYSWVVTCAVAGIAALLIYRIGFRPQRTNVQPSRDLRAAPMQLTNNPVTVLPVPSPSEPSGMPPREEMVGIGVALTFDQRLRALRIANVLLNSPASQAGIAPGVVIQKIDDVSTEGMGLQECVARLKGTIGSNVMLELVDPGQDLTNTVELTRQRLKIGPGNWTR